MRAVYQADWLPAAVGGGGGREQKGRHTALILVVFKGAWATVK